MSDLPADSATLPPSPSDGWLAGPKPVDEGWTRKKFFFVLAFVFAFHVALIFLLGTKKQIGTRAVANVPHLQLADGADEVIMLGDPTLFARPNAHDLATTFWRYLPPVNQPSFTWTEPPHYLSPDPGAFGAVFREFVQTNRPADFPLNFKPVPKAFLPVVAADDAMPQTTVLQIAGELARRPWLNSNSIVLPSLPRNDVIAPSQVQALVDTAGNVASALILNPNADSAADELALQLTRNLRFAPAPTLMFGEITFLWHTVATNTLPANLP